VSRSFGLAGDLVRRAVRVVPLQHQPAIPAGLGVTYKVLAGMNGDT
jgi:hypothetical protein